MVFTAASRHAVSNALFLSAVLLVAFAQAEEGPITALEAGACSDSSQGGFCLELCDEAAKSECDTFASCYKYKEQGPIDANNPLRHVCMCPEGMPGSGFMAGAANCSDRGPRGCCPFSWAVRLHGAVGADVLDGGRFDAGSTDELPQVVPQAFGSGEPTRFAEFELQRAKIKPSPAAEALVSLLDPDPNKTDSLIWSMSHKVHLPSRTGTIGFHFATFEEAAAAETKLKEKIAAMQANADRPVQFYGTDSKVFESPPGSFAPNSATVQSFVFAKGSSDVSGGRMLVFGAECQSTANPGAGCPSYGLDISADSGVGSVTQVVVATMDTPQTVLPSGMDILDVSFRRDCLSSGCWKIDVQFAVGEEYTTGEDKFNVFYVPRTDTFPGSTISYDYDYDSASATYANWGKSEADSFVQNNFPCGTLSSAATDANNADNPDGVYTIASMSACCVRPFVEMYRPVGAFADLIRASAIVTDYDSYCGGADTFINNGSRPEGNVYFTKEQAIASREIPYPDNYIGMSTSGSGSKLDGMTYSWVQYTGVVNPDLGVHTATIWMDEIEMREMAGMLSGTVNFEYTVETFVGLANFVPRASVDVLEASAAQRPITMTKTDFFFVATHGENDYTFLSYVNLRLIEIYDTTTDENQILTNDGTGQAPTTAQMSSAGAANYLQVTFVIDSDKYEPFQTPIGNPADGVFAPEDYDSGLIPMTSVRVGQGVFIDTIADKTYNCLDYLETHKAAASSQYADLLSDAWTKAGVDKFDELVGQSCGPGTAVQFCKSPTAVPDQFVSFNIPIGIDGSSDAPPGLDPPAADLSSNVFVEMVVQVQLVASERTAAGSDKAEQIKTTLRGSIPIVEGGVNIFCDSLVAKTDLQDVVAVHIIMGSAESEGEWSRLSIHENVGDSTLDSQDSRRIDSDSIEAGLMTFVIDGDDDYFAGTGSNSISSTYGVELEDLITIHIMEPAAGFTGSSAGAAVLDLMNAAAADNRDGDGELLTDGYALNGAFEFSVDRGTKQARLEPTEALLELCQWRATAPRGSPADPFPTTCILRRDVDARTLSSNVYELNAANGAAAGTWMEGILGESTYANALGTTFQSLVESQYLELNQRHDRAFWINPGYEWTPTQTGGASIFSVSQKIYLFALVTLDEGIVTSDAGNTITDSSRYDSTGPKLTRRMLLQSASDGLRDAQATVNADVFSFEVTPKSMMAKAFNVPEDRVALFTVELQLTKAEACMSPAERQSAIRETFVDYLSSSASALHTVQVVSMAVDMGGETCSEGRRSLRSLLNTYSAATATAKMMLVFEAGEQSVFNEQAFAEMPGITSMVPDARNSPKVKIDNTFKCEESNSCGVVGPEGGSSDSDKDNTAMIAGIAAGVGGLVLLVGGAVLYMRSRKADVPVVGAVQAVDINSLKAALAEEV
mmetsp:Transcript_8825/g.14171  ORF Transcript_8825/g.14171 Transcript_8825/m.14171 type:complete len:1413 (-) Transcript_8825:110-4348(-)